MIAVWHGAGRAAYTYIPTWQALTLPHAARVFREVIRPKNDLWVGTLDGQVVDGKECEGVVTISGDPIPCNDPDGYRLNGPSVIEFLGASCDRIINDDDPQISASFPCDAIEGPN